MMLIIITLEDITRFRSQLQDNPKALNDLDVIEKCEGDLECAIRVLLRRAGEEGDRAGSELLNMALQKISIV